MIENKKGLLGTLILAVLIILIVVGIIVYYQVRSEGIQITSGNFVIGVNYDQPNNQITDVSSNTTLNTSNSLENRNLSSNAPINLSDNITIRELS